MESLKKDYPSGFVEYHNKHGQLHREDGPARIYPSGMREWYILGVRHRIGGPAIEFPSGMGKWYLYGEEISRPSGKEICHLCLAVDL